MTTNLEQVVGKLTPLGFTPLLSTTTGQILKYDFRGLGSRIIDKSLNGNYGILKPEWPSNSPKRKITPTFPPRIMLEFDGEDDYLETKVSKWDPHTNFTIIFSFMSSIPQEKQIRGMTEFGVDSPGRHLYEAHHQRLYWRDEDNELAYIMTGLSYETNKLYEIVLTRKGTTLKGGYNGKYQWTGEDTRTGRAFYLGKTIFGAYIPYEYFHGLIGKICIYKRALSEDEL